MSDTNKCTELMRNKLNSNCIDTWRSLAYNLEEENEKLRVALEFYANKDNWSLDEWCDRCIMYSGWERARGVLK